MNRKITFFIVSVIFINFSYAKKTEDLRTANTGTLLEDIDRRLQNASRLGKVKKVESLIKRGANVNAQDGIGYAPLHLAAMYGHDGIVEILLKKGASIEIENNDHATPLLLAAGQKNKVVIELLLDHDANIDTKNKYGDTVFYRAAIVRNEEILHLLLYYLKK